MSRSHPTTHPERSSRAERALGDLCMKLGYCLPPDGVDGILAAPPPDVDAFVDAVLRAEGRDPYRMTKEEKRPLAEIVNEWGVYDGGHTQHADRPAFPPTG